MTMNPPPPGPATNGIVTPSVLAVATAASMAFPPWASTSMPACVASVSIEATAPPVPIATGCCTGLLGPAAALAPDGKARSTTAMAQTAESTGMRRMGTSARLTAHWAVCSHARRYSHLNMIEHGEAEADGRERGPGGRYHGPFGRKYSG